MPILRSLLLCALPVLCVFAQSDHNADHSATEEWEEALKALPSESVAIALKSNLNQYQGGVFENGHSALRAVRSGDPQLASKLVDLARQDADIKQYLKRQNSNTTLTTSTTTTSSDISSTPDSSSSTTTASPGSSSSVPAPVTSSDSSVETGVLVPVPVTSTADGSVVESTSVAFLPTAPTSVAVAVTSNGVVSTSMAPAVIQVTTDSAGSVRTTAIPVTSVAVASGGSIINAPKVTTTDRGGNVVTVTYQPGGGTVSQLELLTTTLPGGKHTVITSYAEVGGGTSAAGSDTQPTGTNSPDLQSGAAAPSSWYAAEVAMVIGAAIGVAGFVL